MTNTYSEIWDVQYRLIYSVIVAGKSAKFAENVMKRLVEQNKLPFNTLGYYITSGSLWSVLRTARSGNYSKLAKCFPQLIKLNPQTCTIEELEAVHGVGPKTARFFLLWTRPGVRYAALDTHVLKWLRKQGIDAPKSTPPAGERYKHLERIFISYADDMGITPRELDAKIWKEYSGYIEKDQQ